MHKKVLGNKEIIDEILSPIITGNRNDISGEILDVFCKLKKKNALEYSIVKGTCTISLSV